MIFILNPQLEHIALIKVAAVLWNQTDIRNLITKFSNSLDGFSTFFSSDKRAAWQKIEDEVIGRVSQLEIPVHLKEKILGYIQAIGFQILKWIDYHRKFFFLSLDLPSELFWTPQGTLNKKKIAKVLIKDENISIISRYKLACNYCLEDDIPELWNRMPESNKISFYNDDTIESFLQIGLTEFWTYYLKGKINRLSHLIETKFNVSCPYEYMLRCATTNANKDAAEYFLHKITHRQKEILLDTAFYLGGIIILGRDMVTDPLKEYYSEVLCILLSKMDEELQVKVIKKHPLETLKSLLDWPGQKYFVETASRLTNFLSEIQSFQLLLTIIHKTQFGFKDYCYQKLFRSLWLQIPEAHKKYFISSNANYCIISLLILLFQAKDKESLNLVFQSITPPERKDIIFNSRMTMFFDDLVQCNDSDLVTFFLNLCISSKDEIIIFKQKIKNHYQIRRMVNQNLMACATHIHGEDFTQDIEADYLYNKEVDKFICFLDAFIHRCDKRKCVNEGECSQTKKLCKFDLKP